MPASPRCIRARFLLAALLSMAAAVVHSPVALGQIPVRWSFSSPVPCDSSMTDSIPVTNMTGGAIDILSVEFRDSSLFTISRSYSLPERVPADGSSAIPIRFNPPARGLAHDSLKVQIRRDIGGDTMIVLRIEGEGVGPVLTVAPIVLNFPRTNPGTGAALSMTVLNRGELPITLFAGDIVPPAPFRLVTALPGTILPGDSLILDFIFEPATNGFYSWLGNIPSGCGVMLQITLNGVTDIIGTGAVLRATKLDFEPANNELVPCDVSRCTDVTISNVGNAPLQIEDLQWSVDTVGYVLAPRPPVPFLIPAGESRDVTVCLDSRHRGKLRDTLIITSNNRSSTAFGLILDVSRSMDTAMDCGPRRIEEAITQAKAFIGSTLLYLPGVGIQDELAICTYSTRSTGFPSRTVNDIQIVYPLTKIDDARRQNAQNTLTGLAVKQGTPTGAAVDSMIRVVVRSPLSRRVIVLLTDGPPNSNDLAAFPENTLVARASAVGIRIFTIGIDVDNASTTYLTTLATGTGGAFFPANDCGSLKKAFETITDLLSRGSKEAEPFGITVTAPQLVLAPVKPFDSTHIGRTTCQQTTITNIGEGDAIVDSIGILNLLGGPSSEFSLARGVQLPLTIRQGEQITALVCFTPQRIRMREGSGVVDYNSCGLGPASLSLIGPGYAYAGLRVDDQRVALPGSIVSLPIYADSNLADYDVKTISCHVRWNKSMLDLREVRPLGSGTSATITEPIAYDTRSATASISVASLPKFSGGEPVAELEFEVLRGDTLASLVELVDDVVFEDGNPRRLLQNAGLIAFDSTCFRDYKPIGFGTAARVVVGEASPSPASSGAAIIPVTSDAATILRIDLYSVAGTAITERVVREVSAGTTEFVVDLDDLPNGRYYLSIQMPDGSTFIRNLVIAK